MNKEDCGCNGNNNITENSIAQQVTLLQGQQEQEETCQRTFNQIVTGVAEIVITPNIVTKDVRTRCLGAPSVITGTLPPLQQECKFVVGQQICTEVDIEFGADAEVGTTGLICGEPGTGPCEEPPVGACTFTLGHYRNNEELTNELIENAGGAIVLGEEGEGLTIVVTVNNANDILDFNPPTPPAPADPPFRNQYAVLYAQLLTANLNVLRGATCDFVEVAIENANNFIANSPVGGMAGASSVQEPLDLYNNGLAPGCPPHCS